jgi:hypothetical protein
MVIDQRHTQTEFPDIFSLLAGKSFTKFRARFESVLASGTMPVSIYGGVPLLHMAGFATQNPAVGHVGALPGFLSIVSTRMFVMISKLRQQDCGNVQTSDHGICVSFTSHIDANKNRL